MADNEGFTVVPNTLIDDKNLTATEKIIMLSLLRYYNSEQQRAWPSTITLSEITGLSRLWVMRTLKRLEEKGYIRVEKRAGRSACYELLTCKPSLHVNSVYMSTEYTGGVNSVNRGVLTQFTGGVNSVNTTNTNTNTNLQELSTNTKNASAKKDDFAADFEEFWKAYPKPKNPDKTPGRQKYVALRKKGVSADDLLKAAQNYAQAMRGTDPRYIKHCKTFLGPSDAWRDYLNEPEPVSDEPPDAEKLFPDLAEWMRRNRGVANGE